MKTIICYLDDLKEITGSDYASAKALKINKGALSMIRNRGQMSDETAIKLADLLGVEREELLIAAAIARSEGEVKSSWVKFAQNCGYSACLVLSVGVYYPMIFHSTYRALLAIYQYYVKYPRVKIKAV